MTGAAFVVSFLLLLVQNSTPIIKLRLVRVYLIWVHFEFLSLKELAVKVE